MKILLIILAAVLLGIAACLGVTNQTQIVEFTVQPTNGQFLVSMQITNTVPGAQYLLVRNANSIPEPRPDAFIVPTAFFTATNTVHPLRFLQVQPVHYYRVENQ